METELNKKKTNFKVFRTTIVICFIAVLLSVVGCGKSSSVSTSTKSSSAGTTIIKGTEDWNGKYDISVKDFFANIWYNTGIYKIFHHTLQYLSSRDLYLMASSRCFGKISSLSSKSAIVLAIFIILL